MASRTKQILLNVLRFTVTGAAIAWLLFQINWHDQVRVRGEVVIGEVKSLDLSYLIDVDTSLPGPEWSVPKIETWSELDHTGQLPQSSVDHLDHGALDAADLRVLSDQGFLLSPQTRAVSVERGSQWVLVDELRDQSFVAELNEGGIRVRPDGFNPGLLHMFKKLRLLPLAVALMIYPISIVLSAIRWLLLIRAHGMDPGILTAIRLTWMGYFWNLVFPGLTGGDVVKAYYVARSAEKRGVSVLTVILDRVIGLFGLALLSGLVLILNYRNAELRAVAGVIAVFLGAAGAAGILFFSRRLRRWIGLDRLLGVLPFHDRVMTIHDALFHYRSHKTTIVIAIGLSLIAHVVNVGMFYLAGESLRMSVAWQHYFVFIPVTLMIAAVPFSVGGIGVLEGGVTHFLTHPDVGATVSGAFAICVLFRILTTLGGLPGAMVKVQSWQKEEPGELDRSSATAGDS